MGVRADRPGRHRHRGLFGWVITAVTLGLAEAQAAGGALVSPRPIEAFLAAR